jgi:uncharacterized membrane protein
VELRRLRESDVIRLIDALVVQKDAEGGLAAVQWSDLSIEEAEGLGAMVGALIGLGLEGEDGIEAGARAGIEAGADGHLIDDDQVWNVADSIPTGALPPSHSSSTCGRHPCAMRSPVLVA